MRKTPTSYCSSGPHVSLLLVTLGLLSWATTIDSLEDDGHFCRDLMKVSNICKEPNWRYNYCKKSCELHPHPSTELQCGQRKLVANDEQREMQESSQTPGQSERVRRAVGVSPPHGHYPWHVSLKYDQLGLQCAGAIIAPGWIMSPAHCFDDKDDTAKWTAVAGDRRAHTQDATEQKRFVREILKHPKYKKSKLNHLQDSDIALVRLKQDLHLNDYVQPICIAPKKKFTKASTCSVVGWVSGLDEIQHSKVYLVRRVVCNHPKDHNGKMTKRLQCGQSNSRVGDGYPLCDYQGGGALSCESGGKHYLQGLVSYISTCNKETKYGVYTDVPSMSDWVIKTILEHVDGVKK